MPARDHPPPQFSTPTEQSYKKGKNILEKVSSSMVALSMRLRSVKLTVGGGPVRNRPVDGQSKIYKVRAQGRT